MARRRGHPRVLAQRRARRQRPHGPRLHRGRENPRLRRRSQAGNGSDARAEPDPRGTRARNSAARRFYLFFFGRMPVSDMMPYEWYDTPNIHFCTVSDFEHLCRQRDITVLHRQFISSGYIDGMFKAIQPNIFGETAIYHLTR